MHSLIETCAIFMRQLIFVISVVMLSASSCFADFSVAKVIPSRESLEYVSPKQRFISRHDLLIDATKRGNLNLLHDSKVTVEEIDRRDSTGHNLLHYAVESNKPAVVKWLINIGANPNLSTPFGLAPLHLAAKKGAVNCATELLRSTKVRINQQAPLLGDVTPLMLAIIQHDRAMVAMLLQHGADPNLSDATGRSSMHYFAQINSRYLPYDQVIDHAPIGKLLTAKEASYDLRDKVGRTPLWNASTHGNLHAIMFLVERGADINSLDNNGISVLANAVKFGQDEVVMYLLKQGANPLLAKGQGKSAYKRAIESGLLNQIEMMLSNVADPKAIHSSLTTEEPQILSLQIKRLKELDPSFVYDELLIKNSGVSR